MELPHPLKRNTTRIFRFRVAVSTQLPKGLFVYRGSLQEKDDLFTFTFVLQDGILTEFFVLGRRDFNPRTKVSAFDKSVAKFLAAEAYAFKKHGLDLPYSYMNTRLSKYLIKSGLTKNKVDTLRYKEYFSTLAKESKSFMNKHKLESLVPDTSNKTLTLETSVILHKTSYQTPAPEETKRYQSLLLSGFAPLGANLNASNATPTAAPLVLKLVVREYKALSGSTKLRNQDFAVYMDRFSHISTAMANASWL
jgi:hypothetical protein